VKRSKIAQTLWDAWCIGSLVGIWPRFIEPSLLLSSTIFVPIKNLKKKISILHFSDLHLNEQTSDRFLKKIIAKSKEKRSDLIIFSGDFLCYSKLDSPKRLIHFLNQFQAPLGCFATLGNHDYLSHVSVNLNGDYDVIQDESSDIIKGIKLLFSNPKLTGQATEKAQAIKENPRLLQALEQTPFKLLNNQTVIIDDHLNLCGLGDLMLGRCLPEMAFQGWQKDLAGVVISHHPDTIEKLSAFPGELILSGHTHGGQVNFPWMWKKFTLMKKIHLKSGLVNEAGKWIHVSRGVGSSFPFRWFSPPQITHIHLERAL
jgi:predicted MPP superfamily phosphohydrolase